MNNIVYILLRQEVIKFELPFEKKSVPIEIVHIEAVNIAQLCYDHLLFLDCKWSIISAFLHLPHPWKAVFVNVV